MTERDILALGIQEVEKQLALKLLSGKYSQRGSITPARTPIDHTQSIEGRKLIHGNALEDISFGELKHFSGPTVEI